MEMTMKFQRILFMMTVGVGLVVGLLSCSKEVNSKINFIFKEGHPDEVIAKIDNILIDRKTFIKDIASDLYEAEMKVYHLKIEHLKKIILQKLMMKDARKKELSEEQFLQKYILKQTKDSEIDDVKIDAFIQAKKIPKQHINEKIKKRVRKFLEIEQKKKSIESWIASQTVRYPIEVYFKEPTRPSFNISVGDAPILGSPTAKVEIIEFSDFQCSFCLQGVKVLKDLHKKYGDKIKIAFKHFPLPFHQHAQGAAEASLCAREQNSQKFWEMHDALFGDQGKLSNLDLKNTAERLGLDKALFTQCLDSHKYAKKVADDVREGKKFSVKSTPTFFVNGMLLIGVQDISIFSQLIDAELKK